MPIRPKHALGKSVDLAKIITEIVPASSFPTVARETKRERERERERKREIEREKEKMRSYDAFYDSRNASERPL